MVSAADLQRTVLVHVAVSSCGKYAGQFNMFVPWCETWRSRGLFFPASDATVALYVQSVMNGAKIFALVKAASAAISLY
jgi:hypothetical protein